MIDYEIEESSDQNSLSSVSESFESDEEVAELQQKIISKATKEQKMLRTGTIKDIFKKKYGGNKRDKWNKLMGYAKSFRYSKKIPFYGNPYLIWWR